MASRRRALDRPSLLATQTGYDVRTEERSAGETRIAARPDEIAVTPASKNSPYVNDWASSRSRPRCATRRRGTGAWRQSSPAQRPAPTRPCPSTRHPSPVKNLRHNLDDPTGTPPPGVTVADTPLTIPPATQPTSGISGAAYYNNDLDPATATTLFTVDPGRDQVGIQSPANAGLLTTTGTLGMDVEAGSDVGFDIHYSADGPGADGWGLAALKVNGTYRMYRLELLTGRARLVDAFPAHRQVTDLTAGFRRDELEGVLLGEGNY